MAMASRMLKKVTAKVDAERGPDCLSRVLLILFFAVLVGYALSHGSVALGAQDTLPTVDPGYRLGAEDIMLVSVWKDEQLTREVVVRPDGMFSFPLVGDIQAEDRTVEEIRADLVKRLTKYIPNPNVSVAVMKVLSYKVYVVGRVTKPGEYLIGHYTDVLQALSLAGGLTPFAAENDIKVIRRSKGNNKHFPSAMAISERDRAWSRIFSCSVATSSWFPSGRLRFRLRLRIQDSGCSSLTLNLSLLRGSLRLRSVEGSGCKIWDALHLALTSALTFLGSFFF